MDSENLPTVAGGSTQIAMHAVRNLLGSGQQTSLFDENKLKEFAETFGIELGTDITQYGIALTENQLRVMEAILYGFSQTRYKGNLEPLDKRSFAKEKNYPGENLPNAYNYCTEIPKLQITQAQIIQWAGVNPRSAGDVQAALDSLRHLGMAQYCFYYTRLAFNEDGTPKKDSDGDWQKEEVVAIDTLFTIKSVRDKKSGILEYYEIMPSPIFLDQRESYHMLIPFNWREEIHSLIGSKRASSYTFRFILFLRYMFELHRRKKQEEDALTLKYTPEEMAVHLKMPESVYKRKKDRMNKILDEVYSVAKQLGYLKGYERTATKDFLHLNGEKYLLPRNKEKLLPRTDEHEVTSPDEIKARELLNYMIDERRKIDPKYNTVGGQVRDYSLKHLVELLKIRDFDEIKEVISWGINHKFWITKIGTPSKLHKNFEDAVAEMRLKLNGETGRGREQKNRELAAETAQRLNDRNTSIGKPIKIEVLTQYVEVSSAGESYPTHIKYSENGFEGQLDSALRKRGLSLK